MKKKTGAPRRKKALRRTALALVLFLLVWLTPFYHVTPGQATRREAWDRMLEARAEVLETRYFWEGALYALQLSRAGEDALLVLTQWNPLTGWGELSSSLTKAGAELDLGFLTCSTEGMGVLAAFGRVRSSEAASLVLSVQRSGVQNGVWTTEPAFQSAVLEASDFLHRDEGRYFLQLLPVEVNGSSHWNVIVEARDGGGRSLVSLDSDGYW